MALLCSAGVLAGCQRQISTEGTSLRMAFEAAPGRLDPRYAVDAYASRITSLVHASLVATAPDGGHLPYLAASWETPDPLTWRFRLRSGFLFHDGSPVTAADVVATYRALLDPALASPKRAVLASITSVDETAEDTVEFRLAHPDGAFLEAAGIAVLPRGIAAHTATLASTQLVGAGPYRLKSAQQSGPIELEAFAPFALGAPTLPAITIRIVPDALMRALELRHGSIDFVQSALDPDTIDWLETNEPLLAVTRSPSNNFQYLGMNLDDPVLSDRRVRRAIAVAIDREAIVRNVLEGQAKVASGLLPPENWAYREIGPRLRFDPARAARLLDRAGLVDPDADGPRPRLVLGYKTATNDLARRTAEVIAGQLAAVGIRVEVLSYEWGTFFEDVRRGRFQLYSLQWVGVTDPDLYRQILHSKLTPPDGNNRGRYRNRRVDALVERAATETSRETRRKLYGRVARLVARDLPYIPLWWPERIVVATRRLAGFTPHPSGDLFDLYRSHLDRAP